jgi:hypothetical protein
MDAPRPVDYDLALLGEGTVGPVDQRRSQLAFESRDVGRDIGLDGVQTPGCGGERADIGNSGESGELAQVHHW